MQRNRVVRYFLKLDRYKKESNPISTKFFFSRNCLATQNWSGNRKNCTCLPECNSIDYTVVNRELEILTRMENRVLTVKTYVNKSRIKRDLLFSIDYLVGKCLGSAFQLNFGQTNRQFESISVSIGGAAALFLGCSFISVAELIYFIAKHFQKKYVYRTNRSK